jgi:molybdopterin/thiamine biosynthesis adenylyltransferase/rhodanese-related sulfurtransferase
MTSFRLSDAEFARTQRQRILPELGESGQQKITRARVAVVGVGGLGSPVVSYLAAAGVGHLVVIDDDQVELSNLHRQVIHDVAHLGRAKTTSATEIAARIAPETKVIEQSRRLTAENARELLAGVDVIVDGSDSFETRFLVNDAAAELGLPLVWGAVLGWNAQVTVLWPTPPVSLNIPAINLRDVFADTPETRQTVGCQTAGVMGAVCGVAGSLMALEVIKLITGIGRPLLGTMTVFEGLTATQHNVPIGSVTTAPAELHDVQALDRLPSNAVIVDVRLQSERDAEPLRLDSLHLPFDEVLRINPSDPQRPHTLASVTSEHELVVVCAEGPRSARAARHLAACGYSVAGFLDGGLRDLC